MRVRVEIVSGALGCLSSMVALYAPPAFAEPKPPVALPAPPPIVPAAPAAPAAPDVVLLKDGGMLRGTIAETKPGEFVSILMISGELRKVAFDQVTYAGPSAGAPSAAPSQPAAQPAGVSVVTQAPRDAQRVRPLITIEGPEAKVQFESSPIPVTLTRRTGNVGMGGRTGLVQGYDDICTAPCRFSLPAGLQSFGVAVQDKVIRTPKQIELPAGNSSLRAEFKDRSGLRSAGRWIFFGGAIGGTALEAIGLYGSKRPCDEYGYCHGRETNVPVLVLGSVLFLGGVVGGLVLWSRPDTVTFSVSPGAGALPQIVGRGPTSSDRKALANVTSELSGVHLSLSL